MRLTLSKTGRLPRLPMMIKPLEDSDWNAFSIDLAIPDLESLTEEKLYLQTKLVGELDDAAIDIHVFDNRKSEVALTGLSLDLAWNAEQLSLNESQFEQEEVFGKSRAPLLQSLGKRRFLNQRSRCGDSDDFWPHRCCIAFGWFWAADGQGVNLRGLLRPQSLPRSLYSMQVLDRTMVSLCR